MKQMVKLALLALVAWLSITPAVAADRIAEIDLKVNKNPSLMMDKDTAAVRGKYWSDFRQGCNELASQY